jgi:hypothetical protein
LPLNLPLPSLTTFSLRPRSRITLPHPPRSFAADGQADTLPEVVGDLRRTDPPARPAHARKGALTSGNRLSAVAVPAPVLADHTQLHARQHLALAPALRGSRPSLQPSAATQRLAVGESAPCATVAATCRTPQMNRGNNPTDPDASTSLHILRKETLRTRLLRCGTTLFRLSFVCGKQVRVGQTGVSSKRSTPLGTEWFRGKRSCLVGAVWLAKKLKANIEAD